MAFFSLWHRATRRVRPSQPADWQAVECMREHAARLRTVTDAGLAERTRELRFEVQSGRDPTDESVLLPALGLVAEAARRVLGIDYYDVQLLAGLTLSRRKVAELQTGEGKTFVAALPAVVHALAGHGVHVMTVNDYLAERDHRLLAPLFERLGLTSACLRARTSPDEKRRAYACDITYGPGYEFGFDYLRDQVAEMARPKARLGESLRRAWTGGVTSRPTPCQRGHAFAVVDEADSVLIDEANTPLLLADAPPTPNNPDAYRRAWEIAERLVADEDFVVEPHRRRILLTDRGRVLIEAAGRSVSQAGLERPWPLYVQQALFARQFLRRDVDFIVRNGEIQLVDANTGRIFSDRTWRDGLQQAVQAREGLPLTGENRPLARISRQRYFLRYAGLCGMTGTARGAERELKLVYGLEVQPIPTHRPSRRETWPARFFATQDAKWRAIVDAVRSLAGRPILIGTRTIEATEILSRLLHERQVPHQLLNGKQDAEEAAIVARAGQAGTVTLATNMAGRGTDIALGPGVAELGGLHVIGTEPHESTRVDRQLVGRAARQGDPGSSQFFISAEDPLLQIHGPALAERIRRAAGPDGEARRDFSAEIARLQADVERRAFEQRRQLFAHDDWLDESLDKLASDSL